MVGLRLLSRQQRTLSRVLRHFRCKEIFMPGLPVTIGCTVIITPGVTGAPDTGTILVIFPPFITANGMPLATTGSLCMMINSLSGVPYPLVIGPLASTGGTVGGRSLVRMGD